MRGSCFLFVLLFIALLGHPDISVSAAPRIEIKERVFSFDEKIEGQTVEHIYQVQNRGDQPLEIQRVKPGWACTVAHFDRVIHPGGVGRITLEAKTAGYLGKVRWQTRIFSNDPVNPIETIAMEGTLNPAIVFWPSVVFLRGAQQESVAGSVRIEGKLSGRMQVETLSFSLADQVNYKIVEIEPGRVYEVRFTSVPNGGKRYRGFLKLKTGYVEKPEIAIPIWGDFAN